MFTNGKLRQYCTVKRVLSPQQREILIARLANARAVRSASSSASSSSSKKSSSKRTVSPQEHERRAAGARQAMITKMAKARQQATFATAQGPQYWQQSAGAPRTKSACVGLPKEQCLPPNCNYANGKLRQYCAAKRVLTAQQKEVLVARLAKARSAPRKYGPASAQAHERRVQAGKKAAATRSVNQFKATFGQIAGAPRAKSACVGLPKEKCLPPACRYANGKLRKYCGAVPAARSKQQKDAAVQKAMITKMAKARQASMFATAQQFGGACGAW
jgi:hypothetical protein